MLITDPETGLPINLYSDRINQLLKKYDESELLSRKIIKSNRNDVFIDDILYTIMLNLKVEDIKSLCQIDNSAKKLCQDESLWEHILKRDGLYISGVEKSLKSYELLYHNNLKIKKLKLNNLNIRFSDGTEHINLLKILSEELLQKITKEWKDDQEDEIDYNINEITIYKGYYIESKIELILSFEFKDDVIEEIGSDKIEVDNMLFKILYYYPYIIIENYT